MLTTIVHWTHFLGTRRGPPSGPPPRQVDPQNRRSPGPGGLGLASHFFRTSTASRGAVSVGVGLLQRLLQNRTEEPQCAEGGPVVLAASFSGARLASPLLARTLGFGTSATTPPLVSLFFGTPPFTSGGVTRRALATFQVLRCGWRGLGRVVAAELVYGGK